MTGNARPCLQRMLFRNKNLGSDCGVKLEHTAVCDKIASAAQPAKPAGHQFGFCRTQLIARTLTQPLLAPRIWRPSMPRTRLSATYACPSANMFCSTHGDQLEQLFAEDEQLGHHRCAR